MGHQPQGVRDLRHLILISWLFALATEATSNELVCDNPLLTVVAQDAALANRICVAAEKAVEKLSDCGMRQTDPVTIEVIEGLTPNDPRCLGIFHCDSAHIELIAPEYVEAALGDGSFFAEIPSAEFYDSIVVHEITHALAHQTRQGPLSSVTDTEYLAFAMQLQFLSEDTRAEFLSKHAVAEPVKPQALNEAVLAFAPSVFAIKAWKHFNQPENGCSFVDALLRGDQALSVPGLVP